jgi:hypothetical protein
MRNTSSQQLWATLFRRVQAGLKMTVQVLMESRPPFRRLRRMVLAAAA